MHSCGTQIISLLLGSDRALASHLFDSADSHKLRDTPQTIINDAWELSSERRILLLAALDFYSGQGDVFLSELLELNHQNLSKLIAALIVWRDSKRVTDRSSVVSSQL